MFYVKTQLNPELTMEVDITPHNVFTRCPDCGRELHVPPTEDGLIDLNCVGVCCPECVRYRRKTCRDIRWEEV